MSRSALRRLAPTLLLAIGLTACASDDPAPATSPTADETTEAAADDPATDEQSDGGDAEVAGDAATFPVTVTDSTGDVTIEDEPTAIVSLSPTATEMLFAVGAGGQVVAVDEFSDFPAAAPTTDLSGFTPNAEAVLGYDPDLVVVQFDTNDLVAGLTEAGVTVLQLPPAADVADAIGQIETLGAATGNDAEGVVTQVQTALDDAAAGVGAETERTYYHEISADLFTATSATFIGDVYGLFGLENIADAADTDATGFPQLSKEYLVEQDPDLVFLACTQLCDVTAESFCAREGLGDLTACADGNVVELDDDVASRWGPRVVDFAQAIAAALGDG